MPRPAPTPEVEKHLKKNNVDPNDLPGDVIKALNVCSGPELEKMDKIGVSMDAANLNRELVLFSFH
jgi:hypothetical protein